MKNHSIPHLWRILFPLLSLMTISLDGANYTFSSIRQFEEVFNITPSAAYPSSVWSNASGYNETAGRIHIAASPEAPITLFTKFPLPASNCTVSIDFLAKEYVSGTPSMLEFTLLSENNSSSLPLVALSKTTFSQNAVFLTNGGQTAENIHLTGSSWYRISVTLARQDENLHLIQSSLVNLYTARTMASSEGFLVIPAGEIFFSIMLDNKGGGALALDNLVITPNLDPTTLNQDELLIYALAEHYSIREDGSLSTEGSLDHLPVVGVTGEGNPCITFTPRRSDLDYQVQHSTDLSHWTTLDGITLSPDNIISIESPIPISETSRQFLRLKISKP